jgi:hypothetical protein
MKKLRLDPEKLAVDSFDSGTGSRTAPGTVRGRNWTYDPLECTCYGQVCGTTAAPGEMCGCIPYSYEPCSVFSDSSRC